MENLYEVLPQDQFRIQWCVVTIMGVAMLETLSLHKYQAIHKIELLEKKSWYLCKKEYQWRCVQVQVHLSRITK